ncbi:enoyl-CoA hydratase-related protein [Streptomyces sp. NPDC093018]|uniref:enoyl-CoA hydratase/isomerase family protein n=1 Tax=Streptomyces sp. NPDC093018 TaxID=3155067 RepID=UPI00343621B0
MESTGAVTNGRSGGTAAAADGARPAERPTAVRLEAADGIGRIVLDRPPVNALDRIAQAELEQVAHQAAARRDIRVVVLTGGERIFSAGGDIKEMAAMSHADMLHHAARLQAAFTAVADIPQPVVAAINGSALGGGCELALTADIRICAEDSRIGLPEIALGVIPGAGGTQRLPRLVGLARAKELILTGRAVSAHEALRIGLVDRVVPPGRVLAEAMAVARGFAQGPQFALRAAKAAVERGARSDLASGLEIEQALFAGLFATADRTTGMDSFVGDGPGRARFGTSGPDA